MIGAGVALAKSEFFFRFAIHYNHYSFAKFKRLLGGSGNSAFVFVVIYYPINNHVNFMFFISVKLGEFIKGVNYSIYPNARKTRPGILLWNMREFTLFVDNNRGHYYKLCPATYFRYFVYNLL